MKWWGAIWQAILAFFGALLSTGDTQHIQDQIEQEIQDRIQQQDQIVEETQHEIEEIPGKTDDELLNSAESTGLVQRMRRDADPGTGAGGASGLANSDFSGRGPGTSFKARS